MRVLLSGGAKMGKSTLAQRIAASQGERRLYVATMKPRDAEDDARVARHRAERAGMGFETVERARDIRGILTLLRPDDSILLDSVTALLAEEMFREDGGMDFAAHERVAADLLAVADACAHIAFVSDYIYADATRYDEPTEAYRRGLAYIDRALAARCDAVVEMTFGQQILHKGDDACASWLAALAQGAGDGAGPVHGATGLCPLG